MRWLKFSIVLLLPLLSFSQAQLVSGPMPGYSTMKECAVWLQTDINAAVYIMYREKGTSEPWVKSNLVETHATSAFTAHLIANEIEHSKKYEYEVFIDDLKQTFAYPLIFQSQTLWQHRTDPPEFTFAVGSCNYTNEEALDRPGNSYGGGNEIFDAITEKKPEFMLWLGDNIYLREADWNSHTGIYHRYTHARSLKDLQKFLASTHHFAIWDDHDFGPNDSDASFWNKNITTEAFKNFWANPNYNVTGEGGITGTFIWNDCQFFLMDNRYFRTANKRKTGDPKVLGDAQVEWLINALKFSSATFKFVAIGGQFLSDAAVYENHINLAPDERKKLLDLIHQEDIGGVVFLSGDRHHSELTMLPKEGENTLFDWTVSPLTAGPHFPKDEPNSLRIDDSMIGIRNFGTISVAGKRKERVLSLKSYDAKGKELWKYDIKAEELY